jgi:hypothetical protein
VDIVQQDEKGTRLCWEVVRSDVQWDGERLYTLLGRSHQRYVDSLAHQDLLLLLVVEDLEVVSGEVRYRFT